MTSWSQTYKNLINLPCLKRSIAIVFLPEDKNDLYVVTFKAGQRNPPIWTRFRVLTCCFQSPCDKNRNRSSTHTYMTLFFALYIMPPQLLPFTKPSYVIDRLLYVTFLEFITFNLLFIICQIK